MVNVSQIRIRKTALVGYSRISSKPCRAVNAHGDCPLPHPTADGPSWKARDCCARTARTAPPPCTARGRAKAPQLKVLPVLPVPAKENSNGRGTFNIESNPWHAQVASCEPKESRNLAHGPTCHPRDHQLHHLTPLDRSPTLTAGSPMLGRSDRKFSPWVQPKSKSAGV